MSDDNPKRLKMEEISTDVKLDESSSPQITNEAVPSQESTTVHTQPPSRRQKQPQPIPDPSSDTPHCHYWVKRKSRYCKMTLKAGARYCGEHSVEVKQPVLGEKRVLCPLDPTHSVYTFKLDRHLKICNVKKLENTENYVKKNCNVGDIGTADDVESFRLKDVKQEEIDKVTKTVEFLYSKFIDGNIKDFIKSHKIVDEELKVDGYGDEKLRHLVQTSSILGILNDNQLLTPATCYIDLGAGKGKLSYWLSKVILDAKIEDAKVLVVDRASHRHKKDNLLKDSGIVDRLRVDIGDLDMTQLNFTSCKSVVGVSKHLCGRATDFALRCLINGNKGTVKTKGFLICVCCHHQITYDSFLGRDWMTKHGIDRNLFNILIKMVSWCTCGDGKSREEHKEAGNGVADEKLKERELVGWKCKRLLDYARVEYMRELGYDTDLCYYVDKEQTLENICIFGKIKAE
ncbi:tRNA:m(4)X modification enzyme TRM13 homolog [Chironomus tepperi]|uniref:tRNA:m(4)X modification enzyme TRM13 homolog n=1 Tax=Chironomus tepperi TaxID=113505 RepID=UPI00391F1CB4